MELAKDTTDRGGSAGSRKPRRKPLTIDLPPEAVERKAAPATEAAGSSAETASEAVGPGAPASDAAAGAKAGAQEDQGREEREQSVAAENPAGEPDEEPEPREPEPAAAPASAAPAPKGDGSAALFVPLLVAAAMGGVVVALVVVLLARGGFFLPPPDTSSTDIQAEMTTLKDDVAALKEASTGDPVAPLRQEIANLRQSVAALEDREPVPASDTTALTDLEGRLSTLSDEVAALKSAPPGDSTAVTSEVATLRTDLDQLSAKLNSAPSEDRIAALETKLDALSTKVDEANAKITAARAKIDDAAALAPSVAADALSAALQAGRPFEAELAALRKLGVDASTLDGLAPHAASGLPTLASLRAKFEAEIATVDLATPIPEGTGVMDRLVKSARGLIEVRPAHPTEGADPAAVVTRVRAALDAGDLKAALAEWDTLPADAKSATADFAGDATARRDAEALVAKLRVDALSRLEAGQ